jgi:asparagine N-glycosylation enzyme membrane subunit Stt3
VSHKLRSDILSGMEWPRAIFTVSFFAAPIAAGVFGYRYLGWSGAVLFPIVAVIAVMAAMLVSVIFLASLKYRSDRARVAAALRRAVASPARNTHKSRFSIRVFRTFEARPRREFHSAIAP